MYSSRAASTVSGAGAGSASRSKDALATGGAAVVRGGVKLGRALAVAGGPPWLRKDCHRGCRFHRLYLAQQVLVPLAASPWLVQRE